MQAIFDTAWRMEALAGRSEALTLLALSAAGPLYRFCYYRVGQDQHLCEDVVQETMLRAIAQLHQYDPARSDGDIIVWLIGLARNEVRRALTWRDGGKKLQDLWARMDSDLLGLYGMLDRQLFDDELVSRQETRQMVNATMSQLPCKYGQALEAKYVQGQSVRDIAAAGGKSEKAVESLLSRAREAFRATFVSLSRNLSVS